VNIDLLERIAEQLKVPMELLFLEARQHSGELSSQQAALFDQAKQLLVLASRIERDGDTHAKSEGEAKTPPAVSQHPDRRSSRTSTRRQTQRSRRSGQVPPASLQSNTRNQKKG
jgi:hypothetical protein